MRDLTGSVSHPPAREEPPAAIGPVTLGLDTFGEVSGDAEGRALSHPESIRRIVAEAIAADRVGLDHFAIGEHHIDGMPLSAPDVVLAAIATATERIRLGSAVTVLSSDDPVRVFQRYATLDAVSGGRAELILGRGSSVESFPLFGYDLGDYEGLFEEKLELFVQLMREEPTVDWSGTYRAPIPGLEVVPRTAAGLQAWVGIGGSPASAVRAARHGLPLMIAIIGGNPARFAPLADLYREASLRLGSPPGLVGVHSPGHLAETDEQAVAEFWPHWEAFMPEARARRGMPVPTYAHYLRDLGPDGPFYIGSPETVAAKIIRTMTTLRAQRFDLKYGVGLLEHGSLVRGIQLFGTEVAPRVRAALDGEQWVA